MDRYIDLAQLHSTTEALGSKCDMQESIENMDTFCVVFYIVRGTIS